MEKLFVIVMAVCGKHFNMDFCFKNPINESMTFSV
jgi:hypothetical protein